MRSEWETPTVSKNEADLVVEMWLRQRLTAGEPLPNESSSLTLHDLSVALGAREEEIALLLCQIRDRNAPKAKVKRAIPVKKSWKLILGIYAFAAIGIASFVGWQNAHSYRSYGPPDFDFVGSQPISRYVSGMPKGFGFSYRGRGAPGFVSGHSPLIPAKAGIQSFDHGNIELDLTRNVRAGKAFA